MRVSPLIFRRQGKKNNIKECCCFFYRQSLNQACGSFCVGLFGTCSQLGSLINKTKRHPLNNVARNGSFSAAPIVHDPYLWLVSAMHYGLFQSSRLGSIDCPVPRIPSPRLGISELSSTLKGFLDLVDQHWSGKRSLHLNPIFLGIQS